MTCLVVTEETSTPRSVISQASLIALFVALSQHPELPNRLNRRTSTAGRPPAPSQMWRMQPHGHVPAADYAQG